MAGVGNQQCWGDWWWIIFIILILLFIPWFCF